MSALGVIGLVALIVLVAILAAVARHSWPAAGRHSMTSDRVKVADLATVDDPAKTVIRGDLFSTNLIGGYQVGGASEDPTLDRGSIFAARPRPYVEHWWRQQTQDTIELPEFAWLDDLRNEDNSSPMVMIG